MNNDDDFAPNPEQIAIAGEIVQVEYEHFVMPFSKGILAQSLTSIGLKGHQSYSVGQIVEQQLRDRKMAKITNHELKTLTYEVLLEHFPKEVAANYQLLRRFQEQKKPLVILIGGATAVGKSTVTSDLAFRLGIRHVFGTDIVREAMRSVISPDLIPSLHASSFSAWKHLRLRKQLAQDSIQLGFEEQAQHVIAGIEGIVERSLTEGISVIVEGVHICPQLLSKRLLEMPNVIMAFLKLSEKESHLSRIFSRSENVVVKRPAAKYIKHFDDIRKIQDHLIFHALQLNLPVIENTNQFETVMTLISLVLKRIKILVEGDGEY